MLYKYNCYENLKLLFLYDSEQCKKANWQVLIRMIKNNSKSIKFQINNHKVTEENVKNFNNKFYDLDQSKKHLEYKLINKQPKYKFINLYLNNKKRLLQNA